MKRHIDERNVQMTNKTDRKDVRHKIHYSKSTLEFSFQFKKLKSKHHLPVASWWASNSLHERRETEQWPRSWTPRIRSGLGEATRRTTQPPSFGTWSSPFRRSWRRRDYWRCIQKRRRYRRRERRRRVVAKHAFGSQSERPVFWDPNLCSRASSFSTCKCNNRARKAFVRHEPDEKCEAICIWWFI